MVTSGREKLEKQEEQGSTVCGRAIAWRNKRTTEGPFSYFMCVLRALGLDPSR